MALMEGKKKVDGWVGEEGGVNDMKGVDGGKQRVLVRLWQREQEDGEREGCQARRHEGNRG